MARKLDMKSLLTLTDLPVFSLIRSNQRVWAIPSLAIYPSNRCNFHCEMCDVPGIEASEHADMEPELLAHLLEECGRMPVRPRVHFTGLGEPLLYRQMRPAMELCREHHLTWSMTTNGYLLESFAEALVKNRAFGINVSIHGTAEKHGRITRIPKAFERTLAGLSKLEEVRKATGASRPLVAVNCVLTNENVLDLPEIYATLSNLPVNSITFQHLIFSAEQLSKQADFLILDLEKLQALAKFLRWVKTTNLPVPVNVFPNVPLEQLNAYYTDPAFARRINCVLPWLTVRVYPNGMVAMCNTEFGNLHTQSLKEIINSPAACEMRRQVSKREFNNPMCFRCCHRNYR